MSSSIVYNLLEACQETGCPICHLEQKSVERYLDHQFYENVNAPAWRDRLRASHGFCHEHASLEVNQRLGYSIIYRDIVNSVLAQWEDHNSPAPSPRHGTSLLRQIPEAVRTMIEKFGVALTPRKCVLSVSTGMGSPAAP